MCACYAVSALLLQSRPAKLTLFVNEMAFEKGPLFVSTKNAYFKKHPIKPGQRPSIHSWKNTLNTRVTASCEHFGLRPKPRDAVLGLVLDNMEILLMGNDT